MPKGWADTRGAILTKLDKPLGVPELPDGDYLMAALFRAGLSEKNAMGDEVGLSWVSLAAFASATGRVSEPWEFEALFDMSAAYVAAKRDGEDVFAIPPVDQD